MRIAIVLTAAILSVALPGPASAQSRVQAGVLQCRGGPSVGLIVGSVHRYACTFRPAGGGPGQAYRATARRVGLDVGITAASRLAWAVYAPTRVIAPGSLAGNYVGGSGSAALGVGLGANALVGGSRNTMALQPLSVEAQAGVNLALGVQGLELRYGR